MLMVKSYSLKIYTRNTMWYPGLNPGTEKGYQWKKWGNSNQVYSLVNSVVPKLIS